MNYYNEFDPFAAQWLRELIADKLISDGYVDERSIKLVQPQDLHGYTQCHFFAGIGGWPLALELAGWPTSRPVWTGSCPCQPFSQAGNHKGVDDERHLWPEFLRLIRERRPSVVVGEQVASAAGRQWFAGVRADLEALGYRGGGSDLCAAGVSAPHIRQRLYWVADTERHAGKPWRAPDERSPACRVDDPSSARCNGTGERSEGEARDETRMRGSQSGCPARRLGDAINPGLEGHAGNGNEWRESRWVDEEAHGPAPTAGGTRGVADAKHNERGADEQGREPEGRALDGRPSPWANSRTILCRDGRTRRVPVESALQPLASRLPGRVGLLRGAGNAIVPPLAAEFIKAYIETVNP